MSTFFNDLQATPEALLRLGASLETPIQIRCYDGTFGLDSGVLKVVHLSKDGKFQAYFEEQSADDGSLFLELRTYDQERLKHYKLVPESLPKIKVFFKIVDDHGTIRAFTSDGKPLCKDYFPVEGLAVNISIF